MKRNLKGVFNSLSKSGKARLHAAKQKQKSIEAILKEAGKSVPSSIQNLGVFNKPRPSKQEVDPYGRYEVVTDEGVKYNQWRVRPATQSEKQKKRKNTFKESMDPDEYEAKYKHRVDVQQTSKEFRESKRDDFIKLLNSDGRSVTHYINGKVRIEKTPHWFVRDFWRNMNRAQEINKKWYDEHYKEIVDQIIEWMKEGLDAQEIGNRLTKLIDDSLLEEQRQQQEALERALEAEGLLGFANGKHGLKLI